MTSSHRGGTSRRHRRTVTLDDSDPSNPYILYLPNDFISPGGRFWSDFFWDSYFIVLSLLKSGNFELAKGMVENCLFLVDRHGMVIANRKRWAAGSQLPFLYRNGPGDLPRFS